MAQSPHKMQVLFCKGILFLSLLLFPTLATAQVTIFTESMGTVGGTTTIAAHETANGFDNDTYTMSSGGASLSADIRATSTSAGYTGASGAANVFFTTTSGQHGFAIEGINASAYTGLTVDFAVRKEGAAGTAFAAFSLDYWDGSAYQAVTLSGLPTTASAMGWYLVSGIPLPAGAQISGLRLRFTKTGAISCRLDDVKLKGIIGSSPVISVSPASLTGFSYFVGTGPSATQTFTCSGSNLTTDIALSAPTNYEISLSSGAGFTNALTLTQTAGAVAATTIYVRLKSGLAAGTYNSELITASSTGATSQTVTCSGNVTASASSDIITFNGESATIPSTENTASPLSSSTGVQVWQFNVRDGGAALSDSDNLPTILNAFTLSQAAGNSVSNWSTAIRTIELFDGTTNVATGVVSTSPNQVVFSGLNLSVPDNTEKTYSLRLSLNCGIGSANIDGNDFGFQISNGNVTFSSSGSAKSSFSATSTTNGQNVISVTATQLQFVQQPTTTGNNTAMTPAVTVKATDACGNTDLGFSGIISITSTGTLTGTPVSATASSGVASFSGLTHTVVGTNFTLTAAATGLTSIVSSFFDITAVTNFGTGDIAIVGMCVNMGACGGVNGEDEISFVSFEDITPGTAIDLTDNGFERVTCGSNTWGNTEGVVRITRTSSTVPKGTIITLRILDQTVFTPLQPDANWTVTYPNSGAGTFNLNGSDEQVYILQGGAWSTGTAGSHNASYTGGILMFGINSYTAWTCNDNSTQRGGLPAALKCFSILPGIATANIKYTGPVTPASQKDWIDRLNSSSNWSGTSTCAAYSACGLDYGSTSQVYSIISSGFSAGQWTGAASTDWFDCNNWQNYKVPDASTNVTIDQSASNHCEVGVTAGAAICNMLALNSNSATVRNLTIKNTSTLSVSGDVSVNKTITAANLSLSILNTAGFSCNNLTLTGTSSGSENAQLQNKFSTTTFTVSGNLTLNAGAQLDMSNTGDYGILHLKGNYINNGLESDFKQSGSLIHFDGTAAQSISTSGFNELFGNVVLNKVSGSLTLNNPAEIENDFNFTNGLINSSAAAALIFRDAATASNASASSYANGPVRKTGNDAFTFPVGKGGVYAPAGISAPLALSDQFTAEYFYTSPDPTFDRTLKDASINHLSNCEYWTIDRSIGISDVSVTLSWDTPRSCGVVSPADLLVSRWDGSMWKDHGNGGTTGGTGSGTVSSAAPVMAFSPFTLGSVTGINPLPIELLSFTATATKENIVDLAWTTATETNNDFFTVERSADGLKFEEVCRTDGAGNSSSRISYRNTDQAPLPGLSYYRLKQTDFNGDYSYSELAPVELNTSDLFRVYPNPASSELNIHFTPGTITCLEVLSIRGELIPGTSVKSDSGMIRINTGDLSPGVYMLRMKNSTETKQTLFIKQ